LFRLPPVSFVTVRVHAGVGVAVIDVSPGRPPITARLRTKNQKPRTKNQKMPGGS